jgi:hypothetical protein
MPALPPAHRRKRMNTQSKEFAAVVITAIGAVVGWAYLVAVLAVNLSYPTVV